MIEELKAGDPLAPVTVIVPSNLCGLHLRRRLGGLLNVRFMVLSRVAELIAAPALGRKPLTRPLRLQAARLALRDAPGDWQAFKDHRSTAECLAFSFGQLRYAGDEDRARLAALKPDLWALFARYERSIAGFYDEADVLREASRIALEGSPAMRDLGRFVVYRTSGLFAAESRFVSALKAAQSPAGGSMAPATCWVVPDAEQEIRAAIAEILGLANDGVPLHRMAVLYSAQEPYGAICREQLAVAGVPFNGNSLRILAQTAPARTLLELLRVGERDFRRSDVIDWVTSASILHGNEVVEGHSLDRISRNAGIYGGLSNWRHALHSVEPGLLGFLDDVERDLARLPAYGSWASYRDWALDVIEARLARQGFDESEQAEYESVLDVIRGLGALDSLGESASRADFEAALQMAFAAPAPGRTPYGHGVFVGSLREAFGLDFDTVFLLGMVDGALPARQAEDPVLPVSLRSQLSDAVPPCSPSADEERALYDSVRSSCLRFHAFYPRADVRSRRETSPSRWFLEEAARVAGLERLYDDDLARVERSDRLRVVESFPHAQRSRPPATIQELDLRLLAFRSDHPLDAAKRRVLDRASECKAARASGELTEWDGKAAGAEVTLSASALEEYATCPFRYFLRRVLRIEPTEAPERTYVLDALEKGSLVHGVLREFFSTAPSIAPDQPWPPAERERLQRIATMRLDLADKEDSPLWSAECASILADLDALLTEDDGFRSRNNTRPVVFEASFGKDVPLKIPVDGDEIALQGAIDRIDVSDDPPRICVVDYKTGRGSQYKGISGKDPLNRGRNVQLPIYALAAEAMGLCDEPAEIEASYWFVSQAASPTFRTFTLNDAIRARFVSCLGVTVRGIRSGEFPMMPGAPDRKGYRNCANCDFRAICPSDPGATWVRKSGDPSLGEFVAMAEGRDE